MKQKLILLSLLVVLIGIAAAPWFAVVNRDTQMFDQFSGHYVSVPRGTLVIVYEQRWSGSQSWYHVNAYVGELFVHGWLPEKVLDLQSRVYRPIK
jgi:hypothetical protein